MAFQIPAFPATLESHPRMPGSHQVRGVHIHAAFREFIESLKKHAEETVPECAEKHYRDGFGTLTLFESVLIFDHDGLPIPLRCDTYDVSPLVKVDGLWTSEYSWGFSVDVRQLKIHRQCKIVPPSIPSPAPRVCIEGKPLLFVNDDDAVSPMLFVPDDA